MMMMMMMTTMDKMAHQSTVTLSFFVQNSIKPRDAKRKNIYTQITRMTSVISMR